MSGKRWVRGALWGVVSCIVVLNGAAYFQARSMTHFSVTANGIDSLEKLSWSQKLLTMFSGVNLPRPVLHATPWDYGLEFTSLSIVVDSQITLDGWVIPSPISSGTVILFHGYGASMSDLLPEAKAFRGMGYSCWLVNFRGSAGSSGNTTSIGYYESDDVAATVRAYHDTLPLILYGQSMGAAAIVRAVAAKGVRPNAIVLEGIFDRLLTTVQNRFKMIGVPAFPLAQLLVFWGGIDQGFNAFALNPEEYARQVRCPVLMLHGALDRRATLEDANHVYTHLAGPKEMIVFDETGHEPCLKGAPAMWKDSVSAFLEKYATK